MLFHLRIAAAFVLVIGLVGAFAHSDSRADDQAASAAALRITPVADPESMQFEDIGLVAAEFKIDTPADVQCFLWTEVYRHGKLAPAFSRGINQSPTIGESLHVKLHWSEYSPEKPGGQAKEKQKWTLGMAPGPRSGEWIQSPFGEFRGSSSGGRGNFANIEFGKPYVLWHREASESGHIISDESEGTLIAKNDLVLLVKCRFDHADPTRKNGESGDILFDKNGQFQYPPLPAQ